MTQGIYIVSDECAREKFKSLELFFLGRSREPEAATLSAPRGHLVLAEPNETACSRDAVCALDARRTAVEPALAVALSHRRHEPFRQTIVRPLMDLARALGCLEVNLVFHPTPPKKCTSVAH